MADPIKLPKGYTLDSTPQTPTGPDASAEDVIRRLPKGYILDPTPQTPRGLDASVEDVIRRLPKGYTLETPQASSGGKSVGGFLDNLVDSAGSYVSDLTHAVTHPKETISAIGSIPVGLAEKAGVPMPAPGPGEQDAAQKLDAMIEHFKGRYGSLDNVKEALYKDPVGVLGDLSMVAGGAGAAADAANLTKVAKIANAAASVTDPLTIPGKAVSLVGKGVAKVADPAATMLTKSALKTGTVNNGTRVLDDMAQTMQAERIPFSQKGLEMITDSLDKLQRAKIDLTNDAGYRGITIDPAKVERQLDEVFGRRQYQVNPGSDLKQVEKVRQEFRSLTQGKPIPADVAEALKEGTYRYTDYDKTPPHLAATAEARQALARGLKLELETQIPELASLNGKQAKLLDLQGTLERAVNKYTANSGAWKTALGVGAAGAGGVYAHTAPAGMAAAAAAMAAILADPAVRSKLAMGINWSQRAGARAGAVGNGVASILPQSLRSGLVAIPSTANALARIDEYAKSLNPEKPQP